MVRTLGFALFILITWYLAAMYRYPVLLILLGIEVILLPVSVFFAFFFRRRLQVRFSSKRKNTVQGERTDCRIEGIYKGVLPVSRLRLKIKVSYISGEKGQRKKFWGSCERGKNEMSFSFWPLYCGIVWVRMEELRTYDYFSLCSAGKDAKDHMQVIVFPKPLKLNILSSPPEQRELLDSAEKLVGKTEGGNYELRRIREYQPGDPIRHIHWNLSARTDSIWLKEFYHENLSAPYVTIELQGAKTGLPQRSAFYTLIYALVTGLQEHASSVIVQWFDREREIWHEETASDEDECRDILELLYPVECVGIEKRDTEKAGRIPEKEDFRLNLDLELFAGEDIVHRFSPDNLEEEITRSYFVL